MHRRTHRRDRFYTLDRWHGRELAPLRSPETKNYFTWSTINNVRLLIWYHENISRKYHPIPFETTKWFDFIFNNIFFWPLANDNIFFDLRKGLERKKHLSDFNFLIEAAVVVIKLSISVPSRPGQLSTNLTQFDQNDLPRFLIKATTTGQAYKIGSSIWQNRKYERFVSSGVLKDPTTC